MKPEAQRIAIAKVCGYVPCDHWKPFNAYSQMKGECGHEKCYPRGAPPHYESSLEAMHEAEVHLADPKYAKVLTSVVLGGAMPRGLDDVYMTLTATAAQRAEAFLRIVGKWVQE